MKHLLTCLAILLTVHAQCQISTDTSAAPVPLAPEPAAPIPGRVFKLKPAVDVPLTVIGTGWSLYAFTKIYSKDTSTTARILALNKANLSRINRPGVKYHSNRAAALSDKIFYGSMPLPLFLLVDKRIRHDAGRVGVLFMESMAVTGLLYTSAVYFKDKYRPYAYSSEVPLEKRKGGGGKNSFFAGHVALVGTSTFFMASMLSAYHPEWKNKWILYTIAGGAAATTGYLRYKGGQHFLTDILIGAAVGPLSGLLVPHFHKVKGVDSRMSLRPYYGKQKGVVFTYALCR